MPLERVEPVAPGRPVRREPFVDLAQRFGTQPIDAPLRVDPHLDDARVAQHAQVLRDGRLTDPERRDEVPDRALLLPQQVEDAPAVGFTVTGTVETRFGPGTRMRLETGPGGGA